MNARSIRTFAILPAAGRSVRIGRPKLLLPLADGRSLVEHVLGAWRASQTSAIVVVVRGDDVALAERCRGERTTVVQPEVDPSDMKASIAAGLDYVRAEHAPRADDAWLVAPADMPLLPAAAIDAVIAAYHECCRGVVPVGAAIPRPSLVVPYCRGRRGHPVLFPWSLAAAVAKLATDEGLNRLLERYPSLAVDVADEGILNDVDTAEDYARLRRGGGI